MFSDESVPEVISDETTSQMGETRSSLIEKVSALEHAVVRIAQDATTAVSDAVQGIQDAVRSSGESVQNLTQTSSDTVRDAVQSGLASAKHAFDVRSHIRRNPYLAVVGAVVLGIVCGRLIRK